MKKFFTLLLLISLHILLLFNLRYIAWPENLLWPYLSHNGLVLYKDVFHVYAPLYFCSLSAFTKIFGISLGSLAFLTYIVVIFSDLLLWIASKRSNIVVFVYIFLQIFFEGNGLWHDQFLVPFLLLSYILFKDNRVFLTGIFIGICITVKQNTVVFLLPYIAGLIYSGSIFKNTSKLLAGTTIPFFVVALVLYKLDLLQLFFDQAVVFLLTKQAHSGFQNLLPTISQLIATLLIITPGLLFSIRRNNVVLVGLIFAGTFCIFPRFGYFHLQPAIPFVLLALSQITPLLTLLVIFSPLFLNYFLKNFHQSQKFYNNEVLTTSVKIKSYINDQRYTLFFATGVQYYFLTESLPVGNYYSDPPPILISERLQERMITDLIKFQPRYVFGTTCYFNNGKCYLPEKLFEYIQKNYHEISKLADGTSVFENNPVSE